MTAIKSIKDIGKKFIDVTPGRAVQYGAGVKNPKKDWEQSTVAAEDNYEAGVTAAITRKAFSAGVKEAGNSKYKKGVEEKGVSRWPVGIRLALAAFVKGYGPYRDEIERTELPQRYPRRDPRNIDRVAAITKALGDLKERRGS
ncbi:hypothetical protein LCGC14_0951660 [marine sediment metagenome]|uniref:Uncharacterized protein n=1 Tax=marine sediment metagenome TaxID=412755 RepID=A0A0F9P390_9ZZZZ